MIRAVLFDLDGVLVDSSRATVRFFQQLFAQDGRSVPTQRQLAPLMPLTLRNLLNELVPGDPVGVEQLVELAYRSEYPVDEVVATRCVPEAIDQLRGRYKTGVVTSRISRDTHLILNSIMVIVDVVLCIEDYLEPKPSPVGLLAACRTIDVAPSEAIYVGDASTDIEAARSAGMCSIRFADEVDQHADATIGSLCGLEAAVEALRAGRT